MRFFIALEIPEECRDQLRIVQNHLEEIIPGIRITDNSKLHLTIAFVGEQSDKLENDLVEVLRKATLDIPPFTITPAYIDGFPELHHAYVLWAGVKGDIDKLMVIRERIKDGLASLGLDPDERRYIPHIAIAKTNHSFSLRPEQEAKMQKIMSSPFDPIQISSIKLFESIPQDGFHKHNTLAEIRLIQKTKEAEENYLL